MADVEVGQARVMGLVISGIVFFMTGVKAIEIYNMRSYCGSSLNMTSQMMSQLMIQLTDNNVYDNNMDCEMTIVTSDNYSLIFYISYLSFPTCDDWLILYGDTSTPDNAITPQICTQNNDFYTTPGMKGILRFNSNGADNEGNFQIVVTAFYAADNGSCMVDDYKCENNRCLNSSLRCNNWDNCGDASDESECSDGYGNENRLEGLLYVGIAIIVPIAIIIIIAIIVTCVLLHKKKKGMVGLGRAKQTGDPSVSFSNPKI